VKRVPVVLVSFALAIAGQRAVARLRG